MIWVVAEERSGSSWLCREIANRLGKKVVGVDEYQTNPSWVHHTHEFEFLTRFPSTQFVIRTTRRDRYQQFLSYAFFIKRKANGWRHPHVSTHVPKSEAKFQEMLALPPLTIERNEVDEWLKMNKERQALWDAHKGHKQTIYYEDLLDSISIPALGIDSIGFKDGGNFKKLPYVKEDHFNNASEIKEWISTSHELKD